MFEIEEYIVPTTLEDAYQILENDSSAVVLGGCGYLKLANRKIGTAIDLSALNLDFINENDDTVEIGAMTSLRDLETHLITQSRYSGILASSIESIVGIQLRNNVTIGGSVAGRYAFSDPICALLALDAELELFSQGRVTLSNYLEDKQKKDILVKVVIPYLDLRAAYQSVRRNSTDYPMLNCAVSEREKKYRVVVGSRPARAALAKDASEFLSTNVLNANNIDKAAEIAATELNFGDNPRASKEYRKAVCPVLIRRALNEIVEGEKHAS